MWPVKMNSSKKIFFFLLISGSRPVPETLDCAHALVPALFLHKSCSLCGHVGVVDGLSNVSIGCVKRAVEAASVGRTL